MSKREHAPPNGTDTPRAKRRKEVDTLSSPQEDVSMSNSVGSKTGEAEQAGGANDEVVREQGLRMWHVVKEAVNKDGLSISNDFLRQPSKRQYPDYYQQIKNPIALDDIRKRLETRSYHSLLAIKADFDTCFNNAKEYNTKESQIWKNAKQMQKMIHKEYATIAGEAEDENVVDVIDDGDGGKKNKSKSPNMNRLLKSRLQKLVDKTDDSGRVLSSEFMDLPSKKDWPSYYKQIKRPQCLENIFKHLKRKEYHTPAEFANDVELVFSNALEFNQDHTGIWEDARLLRDYFRQLMSDLPPPFALPQYTKPSNGKIKLKMPANTQPSSQQPPAAQPPASSGSLTLRVPAAAPEPTVVDAAFVSDLMSAPSQDAAPAPINPAPTPVPPTSLPAAQTQAVPAVPQPAPVLPYQSTTYVHHYPNASYQPPVASAAASASTATKTSTSVPNPLSDSQARQQTAQSLSNSPAPPIHPNHQLKTISLVTDSDRPFTLDHRDGVRSWAIRLGPTEKCMHVGDVKFLGDEEEESSGGEEDTEEREEEEEEEEAEVELPVKNGKKKGKGKAKAKSKTSGRATTRAKALRIVKKKVPKLEEIQVKLNGSLVKETEDRPGTWQVDIPFGSATLEIGEKGGLIWKVYLERRGET